MDLQAIFDEELFRERYSGVFAALDKAKPETVPDAMKVITAHVAGSGKPYDADGLQEDWMTIYCNWLWQKHRTVYNIDPDLFQELAQQAQHMQAEDAVLPGDLLQRLPYQCISVEAPSFAFTNPDTGEDASPEYNGHMYITCAPAGVYGNGKPDLITVANSMIEDIVYYLPIRGTLEESAAALRDSIDPELKDKYEESYEIAPSMLAAAIVLYLQSVNADLQRRPAPKPAKKTGLKKPGQKKPPKPAKIIDTGIHVGATLRQYRKTEGVQHNAGTGSGSAKRPHSRRGHFHSFWTGSRSDPENRKLLVKWVEPTFIHGGDQAGTATVHEVK